MVLLSIGEIAVLVLLLPANAGRSGRGLLTNTSADIKGRAKKKAKKRESMLCVSCMMKISTFSVGRTQTGNTFLGRRDADILQSNDATLRLKT